jgi:hypothetical protein
VAIGWGYDRHSIDSVLAASLGIRHRLVVRICAVIRNPELFGCGKRLLAIPREHTGDQLIFVVETHGNPMSASDACAGGASNHSHSHFPSTRG